MDPDPRGSMGLGGTMSGGFISYGTFIDAIDYKTGKIVWRHEISGGAGLLATAGNLLFSGDGQNLVAYDPKIGKPLWHSRIGPAGNAPETYLPDGKQYILATGGDQIFAFVLNQKCLGWKCGRTDFLLQMRPHSSPTRSHISKAVQPSLKVLIRRRTPSKLRKEVVCP